MAEWCAVKIDVQLPQGYNNISLYLFFQAEAGNGQKSKHSGGKPARLIELINDLNPVKASI